MENLTPQEIQRLKDKAKQLRLDILDMSNHCGLTHVGGEFSMMEVAVALYYRYMNFNPEKLDCPDRDRFVLSKGHCADLLYNILIDHGVYTREEVYAEYNQPNGRFAMHPDRSLCKGVDASTGALGNGLSMAVGMALCGRMDDKNYRVFCMLGDGEIQEGAVWEAAMAGGYYKLGNLIAIVDYNKLQGCGPVEEHMGLHPLPDKFRAFNWDVYELQDGNDMEEVCKLLESLPASDSQTPRKPICIISNTVKGKGVSFAENNWQFHCGNFKGDLLAAAIASVEAM